MKTFPASALIASVVGLGSGAALASGSVPMPDGAPWWLGWALTAGMTVVPLIAGAWMRGRAARAERLAQADRLRAAKMRADNDPTNDARAAELEDRAVELEADAAGLRAALGKGKSE